MIHSEIYAKLTTVFQDVFEDDDLVPTAETTAADVDGWDSLAHVRLILTVQKAFGIKFSASDIAGMKNVGDLVHLIEAHG
ncbi:acyl carrier protein [Burkholderia pseudomultivorans]|uniref:Acyl carrier protein n=1 Tax=Burkholderia pseudomultivorans TaxID=1207504 RepID=A0A6P2KAD6_9BURK|nr:acyl carrier protein [Burkholderia pseudomultivorans]MDR8726570.1 Acyl carrier protein [Burkholderia pseudomultivorans]MDR8736403.1 Acyl carrier protein [Burkholderia pseudomultivorans]MDR8742217.1 Acyl carrier protein [Burkholderia pseudomultivorans]MDR8754001.1 Acyl carrier protein [Burkholderia pseudomultivorans]MDR8778889.1 Acyl carrier protein [Burkholderia pseudomultivorans]